MPHAGAGVFIENTILPFIFAQSAKSGRAADACTGTFAQTHAHSASVVFAYNSMNRKGKKKIIKCTSMLFFVHSLERFILLYRIALKSRPRPCTFDRNTFLLRSKHRIYESVRIEFRCSRPSLSRRQRHTNNSVFVHEHTAQS